MGIAQEFVQRVAKTDAWASEYAGQVGERRDTTLSSSGVAHMKNDSGRDGGSRILPIPLLRAVLARSDDHVRHVLRIADIPRGVEPKLGQRIESRGAACLDRRELEAVVSALMAESGSLGPVLALDVVDDGAFVPCQQRWND